MAQRCNPGALSDADDRIKALQHGFRQLQDTEIVVLHEQALPSALSGSSNQRPGFQALQAAMRRGDIDIVLAPRERLETQVLQVLAEHLVEPVLAEVSAEQCTTARNRLAAEAGAQGDQLRRVLATAGRKLANLIDAIAEGLRSPGVEAKLRGLEAQPDRVTFAMRRTKPTLVRLMPKLGACYRRALGKLREQLSGPPQDPEAMRVARQLIEQVVIHTTSPRKPPGFTVEGHTAKMLTTARPGLPDHVAEGIACAARQSDTEGTGAHWPLVGRVREG